MTIRECYEAVGSSYDEVLGRLGNESFIKKFAVRFLEDKTFEVLEKSMQEGNGEEAFRAAHTLKGVCLNLGFTVLGDASASLTEAMRETKNTSGCETLMERVTEEYHKLVNALEELEN